MDEMAVAVEIALVRHGSTGQPGGGQRFEGGQSDQPLSAEGQHEARCIAARIATKDVGSIFATPLTRTHQTAEPLARATGLPVIVNDDLREIQLGELEARFVSQQRKTLIREVLRQGRWDIDGTGEAPQAFAARVQRGLATVSKMTSPGRDAVVFTHGGVIAEVCRYATGSHALAFLPHLQTGSITRVQRGPRRTTLVMYNDTSHLDQTSTRSWR